uniref:Transmembrane protein n=1 Tax=Trypanosoma vivax (strain Y486) TaxID=1055687 RepID=G0TTH7_TRYVY|nr:conserved hypothetical protein, fragment [Trypanosoma vivax Y486]
MRLSFPFTSSPCFSQVVMRRLLWCLTIQKRVVHAECGSYLYKVRLHRTSTGATNGDTFSLPMPPPRPASYVPPEERPSDDASLQFLKRDLQRKEEVHDTGHGDRLSGQVPLDPGQMRAPEFPGRPPRVPVYASEDAARLSSTSVHAGLHLIGGEFEAATTLTTLNDSGTGSGRVPFKTPGSLMDQRVNQGLSSGSRQPEDRGELAEECNGSSDTGTKEGVPFLRQMQIDIRQLEYHQGTPQFPELLRDFRSKYGSGDPLESTCMYTREDIDRGLETQPIDYLRASNKLKVELTSGPRAYDPITVMQQYGVMRGFRGMPSLPTTEVGKLRDSKGRVLECPEQLKHLKNLSGWSTSGAIEARIGPDRDINVFHRVLGLNALQLQKAKAMLSDFDYGDRHTAYHVMMSYPYTDWLHAFYMVLIGVLIYELQVRCDAYEFYDEYLGLDLRQVPQLKKPVLVAVSVVLMVAVLFHPLIVVSVATTRFYRIALNRPVGPP